MAARPQWYLESIGSTNSVHPYCRFATQAMQMTPMISCTHGFASGDVDEELFKFALIIVLLIALSGLGNSTQGFCGEGLEDCLAALIGRNRWARLYIICTHGR